MARPSTRSIHGTADHDNPSNQNNSQVSNQRAATEASSDGYGAFRGAGRSFDIASRGTGAEIMAAAINLMTYKSAVDSSGQVGSTPAAGESLDFPDGQNASKMLFSLGDDKLVTSTAAKDNPNLFGPNTSVSDALLGNPSADGNPRTSPETQIASSTEDTTESDYNTKGYGVSIDRNDPRRNKNQSNSPSTSLQIILFFEVKRMPVKKLMK